MPSTPDIEKQLDSLKNWLLVSNKKNVLRGLEKLLAKNERVLDVLDGLYRGIKISGSRDIAGVLFVTDRRLIFVTSELSGPQFEELAFDEIRGIAYERAFSSIIVTMKLRSSIVTFKTFDNVSAVSRFIERINAGGGRPPAREESTLRILNEINDTMKTLAEIDRSMSAGAAEAAPPGGRDRDRRKKPRPPLPRGEKDQGDLCGAAVRDNRPGIRSRPGKRHTHTFVALRRRGKKALSGRSSYSSRWS